MSGRLPLILGIVVLVLGIAAYSSTFTVHQTQQAIVLQFGKPVRTVEAPGLHFKLPFVQDVAYVDKRILSVDPPAQTIVLRGNLRLVVDAFVRYRVTNPLRFIQAVQTESGLEGRLAPIVNDSVRGVLGDVSLADVLSTRRGQLMEQIRSQVNKQVQDATTDFGIVIVDLRIGRADLAPEVSESVYERMRAERQRDAADFRAQGEEIRQTIKGQADREATVIRAEATKQSSIARGEGDAERTRILNEAYGKDPSFFQFYRTMQAYRDSVDPGNSYLVLTTNGEFFSYFQNADGVPPLDEMPAAPAGGSTGGSGSMGTTTGSQN